LSWQGISAFPDLGFFLSNLSLSLSLSLSLYLSLSLFLSFSLSLITFNLEKVNLLKAFRLLKA